MTGQESPHAHLPAGGAGAAGLSASVVEVLAEEGLTVADYTGQFSTDGAWYGDACGCSDDRCIGFHHDATDACGCFPVLLEHALDARASVEQSEAGPAVEDTQRSGQAWQFPDELSANATPEPAAEPAAELGADLGEAELGGVGL